MRAKACGSGARCPRQRISTKTRVTLAESQGGGARETGGNGGEMKLGVCRGQAIRVLETMAGV